MTDPTAQTICRLLAARTAIAFAIVAALAGVGQVAVQHEMAGLRARTHVVNVAGRQRMLSETAAKAALLAVTDRAALAEMTEAVDRLDASARALVDGDAGLPPASATVLRALDPDVRALVAASREIRVALDGSGTAAERTQAARPALRRLLAAERRFLPAMDRAVDRLDAEAAARVEALRRLSLALFGLMMGALVLVFFGLVRPAARKAVQTLYARDGHNASLVMANDALDAARASAVEAERTKADFLARMSHEIRTPLNGVVGMATLLGETPLTDAQAEMVRTVRLSADVLMALLNDVLDLSKIEAGRIELEDEPFSLDGLVADALDIVAPDAARKGIELVGDVAETVPATVVGDPTRVRQVLLNLLSNAVTFTETGVVEALASAEPHGDGLRVTLTVRDTGAGIAPERLDALFVPFTQATRATTRTHGGTGLGLSIARRLAERMGGDLTAASVPGDGSTFSASLHVGRSEVAAEPDRLLLGRDVLVVDAHAATRRAVGRLVQRWGGTAHAFVSAEDALAALPDRLDAAILDAAAAGVADVLERRSVPVVWLAGLGEDEAPNGALTRPIRPSRLRDALDEALADATPAASETETTPVEAESETPADAPADALADALAEPSGAAAAPRRALRILLAEDDPTNQRVALKMLERLGLDAAVADDGEAAVAHVMAQSVDLVLMDVEMPRMGGIEALRALHALLPAGRRPHVLALTGHVDPGARARLAAAGFDGYLPKPLDLDALARALAEAPALSHALSPNLPAPPPSAAFVARPRPMPDAETLRARLRAHVADLIGEDDPEFVADLSLTFTTTAQRLLADARAARDADALRAVAHQIRGSAANVGLADLASAWERVEQDAEAPHAWERVDAAVAETERAVEALSEVAA